jgi:hypothetical protein
MGFPRIGSIPTLAACAGHEIAIVNDEGKSEAVFQLVLPLQEHRSRTGNHNPPHLLAHKQFTQNQPGLDSLAKADVVGDEEIDSRQGERFAQRFELVKGYVDARAERRLEQAWIGRGNAVPSNGAEIGGESLGRVEPALPVA